jgi:hypothetical protein
MGEVTISQIIFEGLHPHLMAAMTLLLSGIYFFKFVCVKGNQPRRRPIYLLRSFLWWLFAVVWFSFPYIELIVVRSLLRAMIAIIVLVEISYDLLYIKDAFKEAGRWIYRKSSRIQQ